MNHTSRNAMLRPLRCSAFALLLALTASAAHAQPDARLDLVAEGFTHPVALMPFPGEGNRLAVVDQTGQVWIVGPDGGRMPEPFLDVQPQMVELDDAYDERGLLGLAFHPDYAANGRFYVWYSVPLQRPAPDDFNHTNRLSEFRASADDPMQADTASERVLLQIDHPYMNHNAGQLAFGPDGMLYVGVGDGGNRDDEGRGHVADWYEDNAGGNGQDVEQNLMGSILRLDVDGGDPYGIPADNPFVDAPGLDEIWAYGLRNPWRMSFDRSGEHGLLAGDVGQELWDEVSVIEAGGNYGWNVKEATHCFSASAPKAPPATCPEEDPRGNLLVTPVVEAENTGFYEDGHGLALVGGYVYRGDALPELQGRYVFGNWSRGRTEGHSHSGDGHGDDGGSGGHGGHLGGFLSVATPSADGLWDHAPLALEGHPNGELEPFVLAFGEGADGELYVLTTSSRGPSGDTGKVWRLAPASGAGTR